MNLAYFISLYLRTNKKSNLKSWHIIIIIKNPQNKTTNTQTKIKNKSQVSCCKDYKLMAQKTLLAKWGVYLSEQCQILNLGLVPQNKKPLRVSRLMLLTFDWKLKYFTFPCHRSFLMTGISQFHCSSETSKGSPRSMHAPFPPSSSVVRRQANAAICWINFHYFCFPGEWGAN